MKQITELNDQIKKQNEELQRQKAENALVSKGGDTVAPSESSSEISTFQMTLIIVGMGISSIMTVLAYMGIRKCQKKKTKKGKVEVATGKKAEINNFNVLNTSENENGVSERPININDSE